ncbi:MAG TPA: YbhB/YbcL family Raf kinase inhibitor-like protein [Candidatus Saccharimonadales bacterium]|nr:YbhB/YbcL family Raf kinase inhibitor-like protein [Candidatus Saccharimonadales bacterium]
MSKKYIIILFILLIIVFGIYFISSSSQKPVTEHTSIHKNSSVTITRQIQNHMTITSGAFQNNSLIPPKYTCDGKGINPPLTFSNVPKNAKSLVMLMDDHDVPKNLKPDGIFDHWTIYNIDPTTTEIAENSTPAGTQGLNGIGKAQYTAVCPPDKAHHYQFRLYALDTRLTFPEPTKATKEMVIEKMQGHIIEQAELIGIYNRPQNK